MKITWRGFGLTILAVAGGLSTFVLAAATDREYKLGGTNVWGIAVVVAAGIVVLDRVAEPLWDRFGKPQPTQAWKDHTATSAARLFRSLEGLCKQQTKQFEHERVAISVYLIGPSPYLFGEKRLRRVIRFWHRVEPGSGVAFKKGVGAVGVVWQRAADGQEYNAFEGWTADEWSMTPGAPGALPTLSEGAWNKLTSVARVGLKHDQAKRLRRYEAVLAHPLIEIAADGTGKVIGVISVDMNREAYDSVASGPGRILVATAARTIQSHSRN